MPRPIPARSRLFVHLSLIDIMTTNVTEQAGLIVRCNEVPSKMSLTADELKSKAQPLTNTDLEIKQGK